MTDEEEHLRYTDDALLIGSTELLLVGCGQMGQAMLRGYDLQVHVAPDVIAPYALIPGTPLVTTCARSAVGK